MDHPYWDVENKDPFVISTGCQTDVSFDQVEYMERCINNKDSFFQNVCLMNKLTYMIILLIVDIFKSIFFKVCH